MPAIVRPKQPILFSDRPRGQITADLLDAQINNLVEAIRSTQQALEDIRRDDGKLKSNSVGRDQLATELKHSRKEIDNVEQRTVAAAGQAQIAATAVINTIREVDLRARDAEAAAVSAASMLSAISHGNIAAKSSEDDAENSADRAESAAIQSENWSNYSLANSDNAIAAKNEATQWAEYLAGPVVNPAAAPAYIENHPYGHGLYYQPVEGGVAGLWSAKWWALRAYQLVGNVSFYYLGPSDTPLVPGGINPNTGLPVPNPLAVGSFYYDTVNNTAMVWNGTSWQEPGVQVAPGYRARYVYQAIAAQVTFSGADANAQVPLFDNEGHDVYLNGVRLVPTVDYTTNSTTDSLTLVEAPGAGAIVQWDLLVPPDQINSAKMEAFKIEPLAPDGTKTTFTLNYIDPTSGPPALPAQVGTGAQLLVSLDGIVQESGVDFTATGSTLTMTVAPRGDSKLWAVWYRPHVAVP